MSDRTRLWPSQKRLCRRKVYAKRRAATKQVSSGLEKDDRALQDVAMHDMLTAMELETDVSNIIQPSSTTTTGSVTAVLESNTDSTEYSPENVAAQTIEDNDVPLTEDTTVDAFRIDNCVNDENMIIRWSYVWSQLQELINGHCRGIECAFRDIVWLGSQQFGLRCRMLFKCRMCNYEFAVWNSPQKSNSMNLNQCAVAGTILIGIGHAQLEELMALLGIRCVNKGTYSRMLSGVTQGFIEAAKTAMEDAGIEEAALATQRGDLIDGVPHITVVVDGSWMKRSYRSGKYDSLSGVGVIIGYCTGKVLFVGVRNKYCSVCNRYTDKGKEPEKHICYKNWGTTQTSTSMEADTIVEGFQRSLQQHGLIYSKVIADGDSSVYKKLRDCNPYKNVTIKKIECRNHLLRSLCWKIKEIAKTKGRFGTLRHTIENRTLRIRTAVTKAVQFRLKESTDMAQKKQDLTFDILNVPSHVFGEHKECRQLGYFCDGMRKEGERNFVPILENTGLYAKIMVAVRQLTWHADSLLCDKDSNRVETFNSVIAKLIGGKRINFGLGAQYETRVNAAVVAFNTRKPVSCLHEAIGTVPTTVQLAVETKRKIILDTLEQKRRDGTLIKKKAIRKQLFKADCDYGPNCMKPDAAP